MMGAAEAEHEYDLNDGVDGDDDGSDEDVTKAVPVGHRRGQ